MKLFCHDCQNIIKKGAAYAWKRIEEGKLIYFWLCEKHMQQEEAEYLKTLKIADLELKSFKSKKRAQETETSKFGAKQIIKKKIDTRGVPY